MAHPGRANLLGRGLKWRSKNVKNPAKTSRCNSLGFSVEDDSRIRAFDTATCANKATVAIVEGTVGHMLSRMVLERAKWYRLYA